LLKGEQVHALAREVAYGKQGHLETNDWQAQTLSGNCLTLIMACIIYWQAKEIHRVILQTEAQNEELVVQSQLGWKSQL
jgi:TnpA family transposase